MESLLKKKKKKKKSKVVIQTHHVFYEPEIVTRIFKGDHWIITNLNRKTKNISEGLVHCLLYWIEQNINKAVDLNEGIEETRPIFKHKLFNVVKYGKEIIMEKERIKVLDYWENVYDESFSIKIENEKEIFLVTAKKVDVVEDILGFISYLDLFFPNLQSNFKVEKLCSLKVE